MLPVNNPYIRSPIDIKLKNPTLPGFLFEKSKKSALPNLPPFFQKFRKQQNTPHLVHNFIDEVLHPHPYAKIPFINQKDNPHTPLTPPDKSLKIVTKLSLLCVLLIAKIAAFVKSFFRSFQNKKEADPIDAEAALNPIFPSPDHQERLIPEQKENDFNLIFPHPNEALFEEETFIPPKEEGLISAKEFMKLAQEMTNLQPKLAKLFTKPVDYKEFRNNVLRKIIWNRKLRRSELFFNNYNVQSYMSIEKLRKKVPYFLNLPNQNEKNIQAGFEAYDAVVDLYVQRFIQRFIKEFPEITEERCLTFIPSLQIVALCIAIKISWDGFESIWNQDFKPYLPKTISLAELNRMELEFLKFINWDTSTSELISA